MYNINPAMVTDFYQLTMLATQIEMGRQDIPSVFNCFFRSNPFGGGYALVTGIEKAIELILELEFQGEDIDFLRNNYTFPNSLWEYLREFKFTGDIDFVKDGTVMFPQVPLAQVMAPLGPGNFIETLLMNQIGWPTMVSTKASRIYTVADGKQFIDMSLRRTPGGMEGGLLGARSAYIGGASGTSNVAAGKEFGIPLKGTMAHSFVMSFPTQSEAFDSWAKVWGEKSLFIIDTYGYKQGTEDAVAAIKKAGLKTFIGVRDDSGDLGYQSKIIRKIMDDNGYHKARIAGSNSLTDITIRAMEMQKSEIDLYGVGEQLVNHPAFGIVYKLVQIGEEPVIKVSSSIGKTTDPGFKEVYRISHDKTYVGDIICLKNEVPTDNSYINRNKPYEFKSFSMDDVGFTNIIGEMGCVQGGVLMDKDSDRDIHTIRESALYELEQLWPEVKRLDYPAEYFVGLSSKLSKLREEMIQSHTIQR